MSAADDEGISGDPRRALGRRPGEQPSRSQTNESSFHTVVEPPSFQASRSPRTPQISLTIPTSPTGLRSSFSPTAGPPSPTSPSTSKFRRPTIARVKATETSLRGLYETQKLLSHLLDRLEQRETAPDLLTRAAISAREVSGRAKTKRKGRAAKIGQVVAAAAQTSRSIAQGDHGYNGSSTGSAQRISSDDVDEQAILEEGDYDTEHTLDLVEQTRGLLLLADKQGLDLFSSDSVVSSSSPTHVQKTKRKPGRFSSFASPVSPKVSSLQSYDNIEESCSTAGSSTSGQALLGRILSVLRSLIEVDCLHKIHHFRLLRPPMGLQAACLDIATWLFHHQGWDVKVNMVELVIGGLYTMGENMAERICEWLEGRLIELLRKLAKERGGLDEVSKVAWQDPFSQTSNNNAGVPTFAFSVAPETAGSASSTGWRQYPPSSPIDRGLQDNALGVISIHLSSPSASSLTLQLASLVPRLLLALMSTTDLAPSRLTTIYRVQRLLSLVFLAKPDCPLDLLEIIAYGPSTARRAATETLSTFFPAMIGHNAIARRPALSSYLAQRTKWETGQEKALGEDNTEDHHFIPWRVSSREEGSGGQCYICCGLIHGFCIKCTLCRQYCHLHCYQNGVDCFIYEVAKMPSCKSGSYVVCTKFSTCLSQVDELLVTGSSHRNARGLSQRQVGQHDLRLVNLFNITICAACHQPLWGETRQAYACMSGCQRFFHSSCVDQLSSEDTATCLHGKDVVDEIAASGRNPFTLTLATLVDSFAKAQSHLCVEKEALGNRSYDEIAILYGALWTQYQLLKNGLLSGSIWITDFDDSRKETDVLQLRRHLKVYEEHLRLNEPSASTATTDFGLVTNGGRILGQGYLFSERFLVFVSALVKSPVPSDRPSSPTPSEGYLTAQGSLAPQDTNQDGQRPVYEVLALSVVTHTFAQDLNIHDPNLAAIFLKQLYVTGLVAIPLEEDLTRQIVTNGTALCSFGLPLLMDSSPTVELLIMSVENLLSDIDLTSNEIALNLVCVRAWPSRLCFPYSLERLGGLLVRWLVSRDDRIHEIVKQYASKHRRLPGVRSSAKGSSSVQAYQDDRMALQAKYVQPWLKELHDQDPAAYAHAVYEQCRSPEGLCILGNTTPALAAALVAERTLERMAIISDAGVMFSLQLELLTAWLEDLGTLANQDKIYRTLPRLIRRVTSGNGEEDRYDNGDVWTLCRETLVDGAEGLVRVSKWFRVFSHSGVEIPWPLLTQAIAASEEHSMADESKMDLIASVNANPAVIDPSNFAKLCCRMFVNFVSAQSGNSKDGSAIVLKLYMQHILSVLRAYGVASNDVAETKLVAEDLRSKELVVVAKRKRQTTLGTFLAMDQTIIEALAEVLSRRILPIDFTLDFMWLLFTKSASAINIDGFLHKQCSILYPVLWELADDTANRKSRARVLLRLLAVNSAPMEQIVRNQFHEGDRRKLRERLLRFTLELADESLTYENLSWRRASVGLVILFFEALLDHSDVGPENLVILRSLQPTQLRAVSGCFEEYLMQTSDAGRLGLMTRMHRLHIALPAWPVLSWKALDDLLIETTANISQMMPARSSTTVSALFDAETVRANLAALGLDMMATGINVLWPAAQRFQAHVAQALSPLIRADSLDPVCALILPALRSVLDSPHRITISQQSIDSRAKKTALVGALFVPLIIELGRDLDAYDFMTQRVVLDILYTTFFKQSTRPVELSALGALQSIAEFVSKNGSGENRLLGLGILQISLGRMEKDSLVRAIPIIFALVGEVLVRETEEEGDTAIIEQSRILLRTIIKTFGRSRLFVQLFKNDAIAGKSSTNNSLGKALQMLRETERPGADGTINLSVLDLAIADLPDVFKKGRQTIEQVLQSFERCVSVIKGEVSEETITHFGAFATRLGKHVAEWNANEFDANPALLSCASLIELAPAQSSMTLLHQTSTLLHLALSQFDVHRDTVRRLLDISDNVVRNPSENTIRTVLVELAGSAFYGSYAVRPVTLDSLLLFVNKLAFSQPVTADGTAAQERKLLSDSSSGCMLILLRQHPSLSSYSTGPDISLSILDQAATVLLRGDMLVPGILSHHLTSITSEAASTQLGVFVYLFYASSTLSMGESRTRLLAVYPILARAVSLSLRGTADLLAVKDLEGSGADMLSLVFTVFRLALIALKDDSGRDGVVYPDTQEEASAVNGEGEEDEVMDSLWKRIWPDWYRLLALSVEGTCANMPLRNIAHTVFLDTMIYLKTVRSPLLMSHAGSMSHALRLLHRNQGTGTQSISKMIKAENAVREAGLAARKADLEAVRRVLKADLLVSERLRGLRRASH